MRNLDASAYTAPAAFERERQAIFGSSWQLLGPAAAVSEPGRYVCADIAGTGVIAVRARDGILRAFRNLCRHRGARLLQPGAGQCPNLRCPYHGWVYDLDGSLRQAPWFGVDPDFHLRDWPLMPVSVEVWRGLLFAALEPFESLRQQLGSAPTELEGEPLETYQAVAEHRLVFDANWKVYTDNFVEGYHIPCVHPTFHRAIDFKHFETSVHDNLVRMSAPPREGLFYRGRWLWMWPNWTLSLFSGGMNTSRINPLDTGRTELVYHFYFADGNEDSREDTIARNLAVIREDFQICVDTHANYARGGYVPGPLSPRHEQGVNWFQKRVRQALLDG